MQKIIIIVNWEIWSGKEHKGKILEVNSLSSYIKIFGWSFNVKLSKINRMDGKIEGYSRPGKHYKSTLHGESKFFYFSTDIFSYLSYTVPKTLKRTMALEGQGKINS